MEEESSILAYELSNNVLMATLLSPLFKSTLRAIISTHAILLLPHSQSLTDVGVGRSFVISHILFRDKSGPDNYLMANGVMLVKELVKEAYHLYRISEKNKIKGAPHTATVFNDNLHLLEAFHDPLTRSDATRQIVQILREGKVSLSVPASSEGPAVSAEVEVWLLSQPVEYAGCRWTENSLQAMRQGPAVSSKEKALMRGKSLLTSSSDDVKRRTHGKSGEGGGARGGGASKFYEKIKLPEAAEIATMLRHFVDTALSNPPPQGDHQGETMHAFIESMLDKMEATSIWANASEEEFEEAREAMEKYLTVKLYSIFFPNSPEDEPLTAKMKSLSWVTPDNLEISLPHRKKKRFQTAIRELHKVGNFKAPRDKMVCILNSCKAVYSILNQPGSEKAAGADEFLPLLIYTTLKANPPQLHSNITFIQRFRDPAKLITETGYYLTHLYSCVMFIENATAEQLNVSEQTFARLVAQHSTFSPTVATAQSTDLPSRNRLISLGDASTPSTHASNAAPDPPHGSTFDFGTLDQSASSLSLTSVLTPNRGGGGEGGGGSGQHSQHTRSKSNFGSDSSFYSAASTYGYGLTSTDDESGLDDPSSFWSLSMSEVKGRGRPRTRSEASRPTRSIVGGGGKGGIGAGGSVATPAEYFLTSPVQSLTIGEVSQLLALFQETWEEKLRLEQEVRRLRAYGDQQKETGNGLGRDGGEEKEKEKGRDMSVENFMTSKSPSPSLI